MISWSVFSISATIGETDVVDADAPTDELVEIVEADDKTNSGAGSDDDDEGEEEDEDDDDGEEGEEDEEGEDGEDGEAEDERGLVEVKRGLVEVDRGLSEGGEVPEVKGGEEGAKMLDTLKSWLGAGMGWEFLPPSFIIWSSISSKGICSVSICFLGERERDDSRERGWPVFLVGERTDGLLVGDFVFLCKSVSESESSSSGLPPRPLLDIFFVAVFLSLLLV